VLKKLLTRQSLTRRLQFYVLAGYNDAAINAASVHPKLYADVANSDLCAAALLRHAQLSQLALR